LSIYFARSPFWYAQRAASSRRGAEFFVGEIERHMRIVAPPDARPCSTGGRMGLMASSLHETRLYPLQAAARSAR